ncbi:MAG: hypothetical protein JW955_17955 [Sedimentisphaerales bacterium]|nr:hypothetical protein [Sedimentisphaerales bacterium]
MLSAQVENAGCRIGPANVMEIRLRLRLFDGEEEVLTVEMTEPVEENKTATSAAPRFKARMQEAIYVYKANQAATQDPAVDTLAGQVGSALKV